jgi:hypothetical protein
MAAVLTGPTTKTTTTTRTTKSRKNADLIYITAEARNKVGHVARKYNSAI